MLHEEYKELISTHALSALEGPEERALKEHVATCANCRAEMDSWNETTASLALAAEPVEPSRQLRDRILESVRAESRELTSKKGSIESMRPVDASRVLPFAKTPKNVWSSIGSLGAIAAALAFVVLLLSVLVLWQQNRAAQAELARLSTQIRSTQEQLARERGAVELLTTPGARMADLAGTNVAPGAHAMLAYDKNGRAILLAKGLPVAPAGKAYQLWFIVENQPLPGKVFKTDAAGNGSLQDRLPAAALGSAVFAITLESEGGVTSPKGAIYLSSGS
jgi:anti-sigma-K factor RskA